SGTSPAAALLTTLHASPAWRRRTTTARVRRRPPSASIPLVLVGITRRLNGDVSAFTRERADEQRNGDFFLSLRAIRPVNRAKRALFRALRPVQNLLRRSANYCGLLASAATPLPQLQRRWRSRLHRRWLRL